MCLRFLHGLEGRWQISARGGGRTMIRPEAEPRAGSLSSRRQGPKFVSRPTAHVENRFLTGLRLSFPLKNEKKFGGHLFGPMHRACIRHPPGKSKQTCHFTKKFVKSELAKFLPYASGRVWKIRPANLTNKPVRNQMSPFGLFWKVHLVAIQTRGFYPNVPLPKKRSFHRHPFLFGVKAPSK